MKRLFLFICIVSLTGTACMKSDVLKQDATGNFRESAFYESGDFEQGFNLTISDTVITAVQTPDGKWYCRPVFTIALEQNFRAKLQEEWNGVYQLKVIRPTNPNNSLDFESSNFSDKFEVTSMPSILCGGSLAFTIKLLLVTPSTSVIATTEKSYVMPVMR